MQHVVITGRGAPEELIDIADTVTEMNVVKHAFKAGIARRRAPNGMPPRALLMPPSPPARARPR
jgi:hypothetical protein